MSSAKEFLEAAAFYESGHTGAAPHRRQTAALLREAAEMREALEALVTALDRCTPEINAAFTFEYIHGQRYEGPTYVREMEKARAILGATDDR